MKNTELYGLEKIQQLGAEEQRRKNEAYNRQWRAAESNVAATSSTNARISTTNTTTNSRNAAGRTTQGMGTNRLLITTNAPGWILLTTLYRGLIGKQKDSYKSLCHNIKFL